MTTCLILATLLVCTLVCAVVVGGLVVLGVPVALALMLVYLCVLSWMQGMQWRARDADPSSGRHSGAGARDRHEPSSRHVSTTDQRAGLGDLFHQT